MSRELFSLAVYNWPIIRGVSMTNKRFSFVCPDTDRNSSFVADVPDNTELRNLFKVACEECGSSHFLDVSQVKLMKPAAQKKPNRKRV